MLKVRVFKETPYLHHIKGRLSKGHAMLQGFSSSTSCDSIICLPSYNDLDKVNEKVNDMEKMIRKLEESNERLMKAISEQFTQVVICNRDKGAFPN